MIISTYCQAEECDSDLVDIEGEYDQASNIMSYTCNVCGYDQEQASWEESK